MNIGNIGNIGKSFEKNTPQKIVAYAITVIIIGLNIIWYVFGHTDIPVVKTRFPPGFAVCAIADPANPTNAYGLPGELVVDRFSANRLFFAAFSVMLLVFAAVPMIGQDSKVLNDIAIMVISIGLFLKVVLITYMGFIWSTTYNRVGSGFVSNFFNDLRACCVPAISGSILNRCPNGLPNYTPAVSCVSPLNTLTIDDLGLNENAILFIIIISILLVADAILALTAYLSKETTLFSTLNKSILGELGIGGRANPTVKIE